MGSSYIADSPSDCALLAGRRSLVGLTVDTQVHDVVSADGAVIHDDVPSPERDGVPLSPMSVPLLKALDVLYDPPS